MHAHSKMTESGNASFYSQSTSEVAQRALRESSEDSNGERKNDALTKALQTKEQRGRVRGVFSKYAPTARTLCGNGRRRCRARDTHRVRPAKPGGAASALSSGRAGRYVPVSLVA
jgi:hypothetical protein